MSLPQLGLTLAAEGCVGLVAAAILLRAPRRPRPRRGPRP